RSRLCQACEEREGSPKTSLFFGLNDASYVLMRLAFSNKKSHWSLRAKYKSDIWKNIYGRDLQAPRRLTLPGVRVDRYRSLGAGPLEDLAKRAVNQSLFISWKHADNGQQQRRFIRELVAELAKLGFSVWWDKTALTNVSDVLTHGGKM